MSKHYNLAFDTEETEVLERVGKSNMFVVRLTKTEALMIRDKINEQLRNDG